MIAAKSECGFIINCHYIILLQIDIDSFDKANSCKPFKLPLKAMVLDKCSECPTMIEGLAGLLHYSKADFSKDTCLDFFNNLPSVLDIKDLKNYSGNITYVEDPDPIPIFPREDTLDLEFSYVDLKSKKIPMIQLDFTTSAEVMKRSTSKFSQLYKIKAKYLKPFILDPINDDFIVMKIYDPKYPTELVKKYDNDEECIKARYDMEKKCISMLHPKREFNSIFINHDEFIVSFYLGFGNPNLGFGNPICGKVILSKYIDTVEFRWRDISLFKQAQNQMSVINNAGIIYGPILYANVLLERDTDTLYIIDFHETQFIHDVPYYSKFRYRVYIDRIRADEAMKHDQEGVESIFSLRFYDDIVDIDD